jgi:hypothetical protein
MARPSIEQAFAFEKDQTLALWSFAEAKIALGDFDEGIAAAERGASISDAAHSLWVCSAGH